MRTDTLQKQIGSVNMGGVLATARGFVPQTDWPELEAARVAHERALEEHMSEEARRQEARAQERQLQEHLATVRESQRQDKEEATKWSSRRRSTAAGRCRARRGVDGEDRRGARGGAR